MMELLSAVLASSLPQLLMIVSLSVRVLAPLLLTKQFLILLLATKQDDMPQVLLLTTTTSLATKQGIIIQTPVTTSLVTKPSLITLLELKILLLVQILWRLMSLEVITPPLVPMLYNLTCLVALTQPLVT